jgi:hypothetical protein
VVISRQESALVGIFLPPNLNQIEETEDHQLLPELIAFPLTRCRRSIQRVPSPMPTQGTRMTDREKILIALREKPLRAFEIMKRVNIKHEDDCQSLLLKMRDEGAVKFDIHKGHWLVV